MTELEALEKSIVLWTTVIARLSRMSKGALEDFDEYSLSEMKRDIDPDIQDLVYHCYLCDFFVTDYYANGYPKSDSVDCTDCCVFSDCGQCNIDEFNQYEELLLSGRTKIQRLRSANRMLRSMKKRRSELQKQETQE